ncbi:NFACT family protein [archaeon]|nr:NFACT family protein [archaeon]
MKSELSSIDLHFLMKELKEIEGGLLDKTYSGDKKQLFFQIYKKDAGKKFLTYQHPFLWLGNKKSEGELSNFATYLRKYYERAKIMSIKQVNSERIVELTIQKENAAKVYFELFGQGNVIICDHDNKIIFPLEVQEWPDRLIKRGEKYDWFKNNKNFFDSTEKDFRSLEIKENISKTLAVSFSMGGVFAEEICLRAEVDPKSDDVNQKDKKKLYESYAKLLKEPLNPQIIFDNEKLKDITPIKLQKYSGLENKPLESFNQALEDNLLIVQEPGQKENENLKKIQTKIEMQKEVLEEYREKIEDNNKKAEYLYANYEKIEELLNKGKEILKTGEIVKGMKINKKDKKITVEV